MWLSRRALLPAEVTRRGGIAVTSTVRTGLDLCRTRPLDDAVVGLDRFTRTGPVRLDEVRAAAAVLSGRDCRQIRQVASSRGTGSLVSSRVTASGSTG